MFNNHALRSLRHRNFRIYYIGQLVSLNGTWMQSVAQSWLVYRLTGSGLMLGLTGMLTLLPNLVLGLLGGWLADHFSRQRLLIYMQVLAMIQALLLATLTLTGWVQAWHILLLALVLGLVQAVETPVRQSFIAQLVDRQDLPNAIALSSSMFHLARFIGPAVAGVLVALVGEGPVFLVNALSFIAVLVSLYFLEITNQENGRKETAGLHSIMQGFHYAWAHGLTRTLLAMVAVVSLLGGSAIVLMPVFVAEVFASGAESLGMFMGMLGAGSLFAALVLARQREFRLLERRVALAAITMSIGLSVFSIQQHYVLALSVLFVIGMSSTTVFASSNALIQMAVPDHLRGRTMALFTMCLHGMGAIGYLIVGSVADALTAPTTVLIGGLLLLCISTMLAIQLYRIDNTVD